MAQLISLKDLVLQLPSEEPGLGHGKGGKGDGLRGTEEE